MPEMNRAVAGHGSSAPFSGGTKQPKGRLSSLLNSIASANNPGSSYNPEEQAANHEHEIRTMVTKHVLAKDMHSHISKDAHDETPVTMDYEGIKTGNVKRARKVRGAQATAPAEHTETPASTPQATEAESAPRQENHTTNAPVVATTIPTHPGTWSGGWMEHNPKTGQAQTKPGYNEFKTRKQHFEQGLASQGGHFAVKPEIKIPNYARKAMQPTQPRQPRGK